MSSRNGVQGRPAVFVGRHQLLRPLGEGGMGEVYLARSPGLRLLAVKVIHREYSDDPQFRHRFQQEVQAAKRVSGFHTPPVVDAEPRGRRPWMATVYLPAPTLGEVVQHLGPIGEAAARALGAGLAEALAAIHAAGLVHRDLKPGNVLIARDGPRVIDFGISRAFDAVHLTRTGMVCGTPGYVAPEQIVASSSAAAPADVFALGCLLAYALTGAAPFGSGEPAEVNRRVVYEEPSLDGLPPTLHPLVASCLAKNPNQRPTPAQVLSALVPADPATLLTPALLADLEARERRAVEDLALPPAEPPSLPVRQWQSLSRRGLFGLGAGLGAGAAAAVGVPLLLTRRAQTAGNTGVVGRPAGSWGVSAPVPKPVPSGPAPVWTRTAAAATMMLGRLSTLGSTVVWWNDEMALGFDAASGNPLWTRPLTPWLAVRGDLLYGTSGLRSLVRLDAAGNTRSTPLTGTVPTSQLAAAEAGQLVFGVAGQVAVLAYQTSETGSSVLVGVELVTGRTLWRRTVQQSMAVFMARTNLQPDGSGGNMGLVADGRCYYQDDTITYALDASSGRTLWTASNTTAGTGSLVPRLMRTGELLLVLEGNSAVALDASTGRQVWTSPPTAEMVSGCALGAGRLMLSGAQGATYCLDTATGKGVWHTADPVPGKSTYADARHAPSAGDGFFAVPVLGPASGAAVLRASDGGIRWVVRGSADDGQWTTAASGEMLYCASTTALRAYRVGA